MYGVYTAAFSLYRLKYGTLHPSPSCSVVASFSSQSTPRTLGHGHGAQGTHRSVCRVRIQTPPSTTRGGRREYTHTHSIYIHSYAVRRVLSRRGALSCFSPIAGLSLVRGWLPLRRLSEHSPLQAPSERAAIVPRSSWLGCRLVVQDGARAIVVQYGPTGPFVKR